MHAVRPVLLHYKFFAFQIPFHYSNPNFIHTLHLRLHHNEERMFQVSPTSHGDSEFGSQQPVLVDFMNQVVKIGDFVRVIISDRPESWSWYQPFVCLAQSRLFIDRHHFSRNVVQSGVKEQTNRTKNAVKPNVFTVIFISALNIPFMKYDVFTQFYRLLNPHTGCTPTHCPPSANTPCTTGLSGITAAVAIAAQRVQYHTKHSKHYYCNKCVICVLCELCVMELFTSVLSQQYSIKMKTARTWWSFGQANL